MAKRRKPRGIPGRSKIHAAPALESTWRDPFEVVGKIPEHLSYQWVAISVLGEKSVALGTYGDWMEAGGWKPVPPKRHPKMPHEGKHIIVQGQLLMQRPLAMTDAALQKNNEDAKGMVGEHEKIHKSSSVWGSPSPPATSFSKERVEYEAQKLPVINGQRYCRVNIPVTVSNSEIEMALYLNLDPAEYVRRRVIMIDSMAYRQAAILVKRDDFTTPENECLYSRGEFQAKILTEADQ